MRMAVTKEEKKAEFSPRHIGTGANTSRRGWGENMHPKLFHPNLDSHIEYDSLLFCESIPLLLGFLAVIFRVIN